MPASSGMFLPGAGRVHLGFRFHNNVVNVDFHDSIDQGLKDLPY